MKNFTSFIIAFSHLAFSLVICCGVGTFRISSVSDEIFYTADVAKLSIHFLHLLHVITLLGVLTKNGAVISLYAEVSKPSFLGAASGVLVTSDCSTKASSFCDILIRHYIVYEHVCPENVMLLLFFYEISVSISVYLIVYSLMLSIYTCVFYIDILTSHRGKCTMCKYDIKD